MQASDLFLIHASICKRYGKEAEVASDEQLKHVVFQIKMQQHFADDFKIASALACSLFTTKPFKSFHKTTAVLAALTYLKMQGREVRRTPDFIVQIGYGLQSDQTPDPQTITRLLREAYAS